MTSRSYTLANLNLKKDDVRDIIMVVDLVRKKGRLGRMSYTYLDDVSPALWSFDKAHFSRFESAVDEAHKAREAKMEQDRAIQQFEGVL